MLYLVSHWAKTAKTVIIGLTIKNNASKKRHVENLRWYRIRNQYREDYKSKSITSSYMDFTVQ